MASREPRDERIPHPAVGDARVEEDDGLAGALIVEGDAARGPAAARGIADRVAGRRRGVGRLAEGRLLSSGESPTSAAVTHVPDRFALSLRGASTRTGPRTMQRRDRLPGRTRPR